ncbi:MAG TPA: radical SAM protein [Pyrinomonadaceae bacterium]|nr:radical SAM protein [Pyrinomonadaceae bacterium]
MNLSELRRDLRFTTNLLLRRPFDVLVQVTNRCNMKCSFCDFWPHGATAREELQVAEYRRVASELASLGCFIVSVEGGEPFVRPDLVEIVGAFAERGHLPVVYTNGWYADADKARALFAAGLTQVGISIDYPEARRHDAKRGLDGAFARAWEAVEAFREAAPHGGRQVHVMTVLMKDNQRDIEELLRLSARRRVGHYVTLLSTAGFRRGRSSSSADRAPEGAFADELLALRRRYKHFRAPSDYLRLAASYADGGAMPTCRAGVQTFNIDHLGNVSACIERIDKPVGNVREEHLVSLHAKLQGDEERAEVGSCQKCCTICRGMGQTFGAGGSLRGWWELATRMRSH